MVVLAVQLIVFSMRRESEGKSVGLLYEDGPLSINKLMLRLLSKRWFLFASDDMSSEMLDFVKHATNVDDEMLKLIGVKPFHQFSMSLQVKKKDVFTDRDVFSQAMSSSIDEIVTALRNRPPGSQRSLKERLADLAGKLMLHAHQIGLIRVEDLKLLGSRLVDAIKPGQPLKDKVIPELEKRKQLSR